MKIENTTIYVNGQSLQTSSCMKNGYLMVPALFFKYANVLVDYHRETHTVVFKKNKVLLVLCKNQYKACYSLDGTTNIQHDSLLSAPVEMNEVIYVPFYYVAQRLGMFIWFNSNISRTYLVTDSSKAWKSDLYYRGLTSEKKVALTFDDGPDNHYTPQILDILSENNIPATFFVVGQQIKWFPEIAKRIVREEHALGNHSWSHPNFTKLTTSQVKEEVLSTEDEIISLTGNKPTLFRPPYGECTEADFQMIDGLGYKLIMWSVDTLDWTGMSSEQILSIVKRDLSPGAIILQHSIKTLPGVLDGTVKALPIIINDLLSKGYEFVTVQKLLEIES
ncbi:hypothetical protein CN947_06925 [Bacillus cereus]|nr:hypothetical protein CN947_06925 [Bacillus cereus]